MSWRCNRTLLIIATLTVLAAATTSEARPRRNQTPQRNSLRPNTGRATSGSKGMQARLQQFIRSNNLKSYTKSGRCYLATKSGTNMEQYKKLGQNVVEFFVTPGFHHLYARVPKAGTDGKLQHHVYSRITGLSRSGWYPSSTERISVLCELSGKQMSRLNDYLERAHQNPGQVLGKFVYGGGTPPRASNCTSYITNAKIGERGESLARVLGVYESGMPQGFLRSLMGSGNDRVKAVVVQNPSGEFNDRYDWSKALR